MFRTICLVAALMLGQPGFAQGPDLPMSTEVAAQEEQLWQVLQLAELMPIMQDEARAEAETMEATMFERGGDGRWIEIVAEIHDPKRLEGLFRAGLAKALADVPADRIAEALDFYQTALGQRLVGLETSARVVMLDPDAEVDAKASFATAASRADPRADQIRRLIDDADLVDPNVAGGMNAALAFARGFDDGGGYPMPMTEAQMLTDVWSQEPAIRAETLGWMEAYLFLAYSPLTDDEVEAYIRFAASPGGRVLSEVLFQAFDAQFVQTSRDMGFAAAGQLTGREL